MSFEATLENFLYSIDNVSGETAFLLEEIGHLDARVQGESAAPSGLACCWRAPRTWALRRREKPPTAGRQAAARGQRADHCIPNAVLHLSALLWSLHRR